MSRSIEELDKELKPCPFCGGKAQIFYVKYRGSECWFVKCDLCDSKIKEYETPVKALDFWNKRKDQEEDDREPVEKSDRPEIGMLYNMLKAIYCQSKGDAIAANSYAVNAHEYYEQMGFER